LRRYREVSRSVLLLGSLMTMPMVDIRVVPVRVHQRLVAMRVTDAESCRS
jgi:hypothetical protein